MTRQHEFVTSLYVQVKLNMRSLLDQVFPAYEEVFYDLYSVTALTTLQVCLSGRTQGWEEAIRKSAGKSRSKSWIDIKVKLLDTIHQQWFRGKRSVAQTQMLQSMESLLLSMQEQLQAIEEQMQRLAEALTSKEYSGRRR